MYVHEKAAVWGNVSTMLWKVPRETTGRDALSWRACQNLAGREVARLSAAAVASLPSIFHEATGTLNAWFN